MEVRYDKGESTTLAAIYSSNFRPVWGYIRGTPLFQLILLMVSVDTDPMLIYNTLLLMVKFCGDPWC